MFEATTRLLFFDEFRLPHRLVRAGPRPANLERISWMSELSGGRSLYWPPHDRPLADDLPFGELRLGDVPFFATIAKDVTLRERISAHAEGWTPIETVRSRDGRDVGSIWRSAAGDLALPFDPNEAIIAYWSEKYRSVSGSWLDHFAGPARTTYYRVRPLLPRPAQIRLRRLIVPLQAHARFPRWPIETALHDLYDQLFRLVAMVAREPVPWLSPWPRGREWALVLTHDVESANGCRAIHVLRDIETKLDLRSSWNFVPDRYPLDVSVVDDLRARGFEIGVHGARHDGRDLASRKLLEERLPVMRTAAERWQAVGFRSPATQRAWDLMPLLQFDYDSSYPDTDPYEPQAGGCCTWLPFFNRDLVELPLTLPQDHTLFVLLGHTDESLWLEKTEQLRAAGGMALLNTHPDYQLEGLLARAYRSYLRSVTDDSTVWAALPAEISAWWRRRAATTIERRNGAWTSIGPAEAEAEIRYSVARTG
jgi:hypothetical protein